MRAFSSPARTGASHRLSLVEVMRAFSSFARTRGKVHRLRLVVVMRAFSSFARTGGKGRGTIPRLRFCCCCF